MKNGSNGPFGPKRAQWPTSYRIVWICTVARDCTVDWVSLDPELLFESKMDATWYTPQSLHNSSYCESFFTASTAGAEAISVVDEGTIGVDEVDPIIIVDEVTIGVDEVDPIVVVDEVSTPERLAGARVEGRKTPYLLT